MTDIEILKTELSLPQYANLTNQQAYSELTKRNLIPNPVPQGNSVKYNITKSEETSATATAILNIIPFPELIAIKSDHVGQIFYDRLIAIESGGGVIDISSQIIKDALNYCLVKNLVSATTRDNITGTTNIPDVNWVSEISSQARYEIIGLPFVTIGMIEQAKLA